jgi:NADPH oxidase 2
MGRLDQMDFMNEPKPYRSNSMRLPTLGKLIAQPMVDEPAPKLSFKQNIDRWMINEGSRRMYPPLCYAELIFRFVVVFILLHVMVYSFGFMNYSMKVHSPFEPH